jgi:hypothetical protein
VAVVRFRPRLLARRAGDARLFFFAIVFFVAFFVAFLVAFLRLRVGFGLRLLIVHLPRVLAAAPYHTP